jgi:hypothetical protein
VCRSVVGATATEVEKMEATSAKPGQEPDLKGRVKAVDVTIPGLICPVARRGRALTASWLRRFLLRAEFFAATVVAAPSRAQPPAGGAPTTKARVLALLAWLSMFSPG